MSDTTHKGRFHLYGANPFLHGWLTWILGQPRPEDPAEQDGWDMAEDSIPKGPAAALYGGRDLMRTALCLSIEKGDVILLSSPGH